MSWEGIKKNFNRAGTSILQKTGIVNKTIDEEFEEQNSRLKLYSGKVDTLHKEAKLCLDSLRGVTLVQERVANNLLSSISDSSLTYKKAALYKNLMENLSPNSRHEFDETFRATVMDPINRFGIFFPECSDLIKKRSAKLLDYDSARDKVCKATDKPSKDSDRLPKLEAEEEDARQAYETINHLLVSGIPELINARVPYLEPSLVAALKLQFKLMKDLNSQMEAIANTKINDIEMDRTLEELHSLSILTI